MESISEIKKSVNIVDVVRLFANINLKKRGQEHVGLCPFHNDKKASLHVNERKQVFTCPPCGKSGDVLDFLSFSFQQNGNNETDAFKMSLDYLKGEKTNFQIDPKKRKELNKKVAPWIQLPTGPIPNQIVHYRHGAPNIVYPYKNENKELIGYVCRFDFSDGSKETIPYVYCTNGKAKQWRWQGFARPRPLYGLDFLAANPTATVMIVEGEKTADAAQALFPHIVVVTWPGGTNAVKYGNWEMLFGRNIILWPDNDKQQEYSDGHENSGQVKPYLEQPGNAAMYEIGNILKNECPIIKWVVNAKDFPNKWDVADAEWDQETAIDYVKKNYINFALVGELSLPEAEKKTNEATEQPPVEYYESEVEPGESIPPEYFGGDSNNNFSPTDYTAYFSFLGFEKEADGLSHCFFVKESRTVQRFSARSLGGIAALISLAPLDFWQGMFSGKRSAKVQTDEALNWLVRSSHAAGFFSADLLRGRGAWIDRGRVVFHAGDHLLVNNQRTALGQLESKYIYEAGGPLGYDISKPLNNADANKLVELCKMMNWSRDINAYLLAGWCVIAPVCGAMKWRSHIWITGPAGSGKSWTLKEIVRPLLGLSALSVQSNTTEPGLRQLIKSDALPVVFDEADAEDFAQQQSIKKVLGLMRSASADDGGMLVMGTSGGTEKKYRIRSCFAFASIGLTATQQSDRTRITLLTLNTAPEGPKKDEQWQKLQKAYVKLITDDYANNLQARTIKMLPTILENARIFSKAAAAVLGKQRVGDQIGSLLAGAYSLSSSNIIDYETAVEWIKTKDWSEERELEETRDENRLLSILMEKIQRVDRSTGSPLERTLGELVGIALSYARPDENIKAIEAEQRLNRIGFKIWQNGSGNDRITYLVIANSSTHIAAMLKGTPWVNNWSKILSRVDGAVKTEPLYFFNGKSARGVGIPIDEITTNGKKEPDQELPF